MSPEVNARDLVAQYLAQNYRLVFWPQIGDAKGPREAGWPTKAYDLEAYKEGHRVGILTGTEIAPGHFLHDVDIDWAPGSLIAQQLLPSTGFVFGRASKKVSHCFYTTSEALPSYRYEDVDKSCLIELRGTKANGDVGLQTMAPPSVWSKGTQKEALEFVRASAPTHIDNPQALRQRTCLAAIGMILAKHLGKNGFGHEPRLAWAGFLLRAGLEVDDLVTMGEAMSAYCTNREISDVRMVVESTQAALTAASGKKVKGGPALAKIIGQQGKAVIQQINLWLGRDSDFVRADGMIVKDNQENVRRALQLLNVELTYNTFAERLLVQEHEGKPQPLDDAMLDNIWLRIDRDLKFRPTYVFYEKVVRDIAREKSFHPVRDYLKSLKWDGESRIDSWLVRYGGVEDSSNDSSDRRSYLEAVSAIVLIAAVRRIMSPGTKYDEMLVLESDQGMNKSTALRALCPNDEWFSDDLPLNVDAKQIIERTLGKWIIEAGELTGGRKADRDHLKSMLSRQIDGPARMAYAHLPVERPRQFVIIGTTNSAEYLADMTGSRRFWPCKVKKFDVAAITADRDQLWAEAVVREAKGESIRLPEELYEEAGAHQEVRREVDAWEDVIEAYVAKVDVLPTGRQQMSANSLWMALGIIPERRDRLGAKRIAEIMQRLGFARTVVREDDVVQRGYARQVADDYQPSAQTRKPEDM